MIKFKFCVSSAFKEGMSASLFKNLISFTSFFLQLYHFFLFRFPPFTLIFLFFFSSSFLQVSMIMLAATLGRVQEFFSDNYSLKSTNMILIYLDLGLGESLQLIMNDPPVIGSECHHIFLWYLTPRLCVKLS